MATFKVGDYVHAVDKQQGIDLYGTVQAHCSHGTLKIKPATGKEVKVLSTKCSHAARPRQIPAEVFERGARVSAERSGKKARRDR